MGCAGVRLAHNNQNNAPRFSHNEAKTTLVSRAMAPILVNVYCYTSCCDTPPPSPTSPLASCAVLFLYFPPLCFPLWSRLSKRTKFSLQPSQTLVHINCLLSRPRGGGGVQGERGGSETGHSLFLTNGK